MVWPALIGAGASLLGKLFGGGKQETVNRVDYARMVRDAEAAGFNPLTALRNGGAAGFTVSTTPAAPLSARLAEGVSAGVNTFLENFDPHADAAREKGFALIDAQIRNLNASSGAIFPPSPSSVSLHNLERRPSGVAAQLSPRTSVELDGYRYGGTGEGGAIEDMWVAYRRPDGSYVRVPNPNLPDGEQMFIPPIAAAENVTTRPALANKDGGIKSPYEYGKSARKWFEGWISPWTTPLF